MMEVKEMCFHYRGCAPVLNKISFDLEEGHFLAILGNNGAGKSTLLKCVNHILKADSGEVILDGENLSAMPNREIARRVAFVSQSVPSTQMTVRDAVMLGRKPYMRWGFSQEDRDIADSVMKRLNIGSEMQGRYLNQLSGGERQKVMLARALTQQPKVLLLDEPTSSLDIKNQYQVLRTVQEICQKDRITAIVVIHDLNLALRFCDRFLLMRGGEVYTSGGKAVLDETAFREVYQVQAKVSNMEDHQIVLVNE